MDVAANPSTGTFAVGYKGTDNAVHAKILPSGGSFGSDLGSGKTMDRLLRMSYQLDGSLIAFYREPSTNKLHLYQYGGQYWLNYLPVGTDTGLTAVDDYGEIVNDADNRVILTYVPATGTIRLAREQADRSFVTRDITTSAATSFHDLKMDGGGNIYVAYTANSRDLRLASYRGASQTWEDVKIASLDAGASFTQGVQLDLGGDGSFAVAYAQNLSNVITFRALYTK